MPVTPTGSPAWTRTADYTQYGGHANKENYLGRGPIDALTDVGAEEFSRAAADLAACARSAPFAILDITCNDTSPAAPTFNYVAMMTGIRTTSYAGGSPPTGFPGGDRNSAGSISIHFESSYTDEYGVAGSFTPRLVSVSLAGQTPGMCTWEISGSTVVLYAFSDAGAALSDARITVEVH